MPTREEIENKAIESGYEIIYEYSDVDGLDEIGWRCWLTQWEPYESVSGFHANDPLKALTEAAKKSKLMERKQDANG